MAVNLSPYGGVGAQFLDNSGNVLTGGKIETYAAGTTTPQATYTSSAGITFHPNPIILDASGRVPSGGEIWLTDGLLYKFVLRDSANVLIATYDNIAGINSNFVNFTNEQEIQTATAGQTVFNLTTTSYQPGTNSLSVFVDGVNQYGPGAQYAYLETDSDTVTFVNGLHVGASVKFTTSQLNSSGATDSSQVSYAPAGSGAVTTTVQAKLRQTVSVKDFGAIGNGVADDTAAIQACFDYACPERNFLDYPTDSIYAVYFPPGVYAVSNLLLRHRLSTNSDNRRWRIYGNGVRIEQISGSTGPTLEISSCKRLLIDGLSISDETWITGLWDSNFTNLELDAVKFGTRNAAGTNLFASNYWSHFDRCRMGNIEFTIYAGGSNQEFNANQFTACIGGPISIVGNANGSFQGNNWTGGELRGNPFISIDAARNSATPNSLTITSTYFDQANAVQTNLFDFQLKLLGVCPSPSGYVLDGQPLQYAGSNLETSLGGVRMGARTPISAANLMPNGDLQNAAVGETGQIAGIVRSNCTSLVSSSGGTGPFSLFYTPTSTAAFGNVVFDTQALPFSGSYTLTVVYRKPVSNSMQINSRKNGADVAFNTFANEQTQVGDWAVASYSTNASAGNTLGVKFYVGNTATPNSIDIAYVGCTFGSKGILLASDAISTPNQPKVVWRSAFPTTGTWAVGDIVYNTVPTAGGTIGWVCTTAGTPGTWKTFGAIAA